MKRILITGCSDSMFWYGGYIGTSWPLLLECSEEYVVKACDGYSNIVLKKDGQLVDTMPQDA